MAEGRKILFFLGAGASYTAGAYTPAPGHGKIQIPTQANFWDTFLRLCSNRERRRDDIQSFLFRYFRGYARVPARLSAAERRKFLNGTDVEEVFTFLSERTRAPSTSVQLKAYANKVWDALLIEVGNVFSRFEANVDTRTIYRKFLRRHVRSHDAIVSFNWDTVFEDSLPANRRWAYAGIEDTVNQLPLLKPHGSVNWGEVEGEISVVDKPLRAVVVAPTHLKFVSTTKDEKDKKNNLGFAGYLDQAPEIKAIWSEMEKQMQQAKVLIFIGYSFPVSDLYFSSVLRSVLSGRDSPPSLVIVNPDAVAIAERLRARFSIENVVRYFDLDQFLQVNRDDVLDQCV